MAYTSGTFALRPFLSPGEAFVISCRVCWAAMYPRVMPRARIIIPKYRFIEFLLPEKFERQLDLAARACACNAAKVRRGSRSVRRAERHLVECVECLAAELEPQSFTNRHVFHQREIGAIGRGTADDVSPGVSVDAARQQGGIYKRRGIEIRQNLRAAI